MRMLGPVALSLVLIAGTLACNREEPAPPNEKAATTSSQKEASSNDSSPEKSPLWIATSGQIGKQKILTPLAMYRGGTWSRPWPKPRGANAEEKRIKPFPLIANTRALIDVPQAWLGGIPPPSVWYGFSSKDGRAYTLHTVRAQEIWKDYDYEWVFDIDQLTPDIDLPPYTHIGDAAFNISPQTAGLAVQPLHKTEEKSPDWDQVHAFLKPIFNQLEEDAGHYSDQFYTPLNSLQEREKYPLLLTTYKMPADQSRYLYYFALQRDYPRTGKVPIPLVTQLTGWLTHDGDNKFSFINKQLIFDDADYQKIDHGYPTYMFQWDSRTFLFLEEYIYESSGANIVEWDGSHLIKAFSGGGYGK